MVNNDLFIPKIAQYIAVPAPIHKTQILVPVAHSKSDIPDNHIVAADNNRVIGNTNATAGSSLPGNRCITPDVKLRSKSDCSGHAKYNRARQRIAPVVEGITKTAGCIIIVEMGYFIYRGGTGWSATPSGAEFPITLRTRKSRYLRQQVGTDRTE